MANPLQNFTPLRNHSVDLMFSRFVLHETQPCPSSCFVFALFFLPLNVWHSTPTLAFYILYLFWTLSLGTSALQMSCKLRCSHTKRSARSWTMLSMTRPLSWEAAGVPPSVLAILKSAFSLWYLHSCGLLEAPVSCLLVWSFKPSAAVSVTVWLK